MTIQENYDNIINEKNAQSIIAEELTGELLPYPNAIPRLRALLKELNSSSKVAIWRLMSFVFAAKLTTQQRYWEQAKIELEAIKNIGNTINDEWITKIALDFQYGDDLVSFLHVDGKKRLGYQVLDSSKQVIKAASASRISNGATFLKVATETSGNLAAVPNDPFIAFKTYIDRMQPPGCNIVCFTSAPDVLAMDVTVYFDPLKGADTAFVTAVKNAVKATIKALNFRGIVTRDLIEDAISSVDGVIYYSLDSLRAKIAGGSYASQLVMKYETVSGYIVADSDSLLFKVTALPQVTA